MTYCALPSYSCRMHVFDERNISLRLEKKKVIKTIRCEKYLRFTFIVSGSFKYESILNSIVS